MSTVTLTVKLDIEGDAQEMVGLFAQYVTFESYALHEDYGVGWGGYEGPFLNGVTVTTPEGMVIEASDWGDMTARRRKQQGLDD